MRSADAVLAQLLAQRGAMDAEHGRGAAMVAVAMVQHFGEEITITREDLRVPFGSAIRFTLTKL